MRVPKTKIRGLMVLCGLVGTALGISLQSPEFAATIAWLCTSWSVARLIVGGDLRSPGRKPATFLVSIWLACATLVVIHCVATWDIGGM